jgi:hypothetical protein
MQFDCFKPAMGNLRPFELLSVAFLKPLKCAYFIEKSTKPEEKSLFWPSTGLFSIKLALEPIWVAHRCFKHLEKYSEDFEN